MSRTPNAANTVFNIFLCSPRWKNPLSEVPKFLDWAVAFFGMGDFQVAAGFSGPTENRDSISGWYSDVNSKIWQPKLVHLAMDYTRRQSKCFFVFENRHPKTPPTYALYLHPGMTSVEYDRDDELKVLSFSIQKDLFDAAIRADGEGDRKSVV